MEKVSIEGDTRRVSSHIHDPIFQGFDPIFAFSINNLHTALLEDFGWVSRIKVHRSMPRLIRASGDLSLFRDIIEIYKIMDGFCVEVIPKTEVALEPPLSPAKMMNCSRNSVRSITVYPMLGRIVGCC